jgi:hypothetical protein
MITSGGFYWTSEQGFRFSQDAPDKTDLVLYFLDKRIAAQCDTYTLLKEKFPDSILLGCSTSGPVLTDDIYLSSLTGVAISFEKTKLKTAQRECLNQASSYELGKTLVSDLAGDKLRHVFVLTDGMTVHGDDFIRGANEALPEGTTISGGMASDGFEFKETLSGINGPLKTGQVCAIGFYGDSLNVGFGAEGGWDTFGLERIVTKSQGNMLYELDGLPALDLYKEYLGPEADKLPSSGLLFPLGLRRDNQSELIVRTIDTVDEKTKALRFSGDIPQGYTAQFMKGDFAHLVDGAIAAADKAIQNTINPDQQSVALVVSCLGRQLLMGQQISDELEAVSDTLGNNVTIAGFYSNGEYSKKGFEPCALHNQTMTLTVLQEK